jgi:hypothetical protein
MQHGSQENIANESIQHPDTSDDTSDDTSTTRDLGNKVVETFIQLGCL